MGQRPKSTKRLDLKWLECPTLPRQSSSTSVTPFFFPIGSGFTLRSTSTTSFPLQSFCVALNAGQRPRSTLCCSKAAQQTMVFGTCSTPTATRVSANWGAMRPGTREILQRIGKRSRIGVISNSDGKIAALLERHGIADCFLNMTDSGLVGREKPHPAIFHAALRTMNVAPEESLYVGDLYSVDYLEATGVGMQAILFDVCGAYREMDLPRVESLEELEQKLSS
ncbi:MAG: hypothetical protein DMG86_06615 [Acidobacteria bacterium]|nr:MAG: hypothetical protein DMG86_06615 [Acidobacteriota bacterium]